VGVVIPFPKAQPEPESLDAWRVTEAEKARTVGRDAGYRCPFCGDTISWLSHLPPLNSRSPVRCFHPKRVMSRSTTGGAGSGLRDADAARQEES